MIIIKFLYLINHIYELIVTNYSRYDASGLFLTLPLENIALTLTVPRRKR